MSTLSQFTGGIKSIQRGIVSVAKASTSATATISSVSTSKSVVRDLGIAGSWSEPNFAYVGGGTDTEAKRSHTLALTNATTITATTGTTDGSYTRHVIYEITEYY